MPSAIENMLDNSPREFLFRGMSGCSNHSCVIKKPVGMGTNASCGCIQNMSRANLNLLAQRLRCLLEHLETSQ
jgi:hypothetical protein